jgi:betaine-aldehyde dehydrogenase
MTVEVTRDYPMIVDGIATPSTGGRWLEVRSPATRELVGRVPDGTAADVDLAVSAARAAFRDGRWSRKPMSERVTVMNRLGDLLDRDADALARLETLQTGSAYKLRRQSDFAFASDNLRFFATQIRNLEGKAAYEYTGTHTSFVRREPIGVVGQVSPWNYPMWMAIWKIGPALAAALLVTEIRPATQPLWAGVSNRTRSRPRRSYMVEALLALAVVVALYLFVIGGGPAWFGHWFAHLLHM